MLALSPYVLPELRMGNAIISAQNLSDGRQRQAYLDGALEFLRTAAQSASSVARLLEVKHALPFADRLIKDTLVDGRVEFRLLEDAIDMVHFDPEHVRVMLTDGRKRRAEDMLAYETGESTAGFGKVISALVRGIAQDALLKLAEEVGVEMDAEFIESWVQAGVVENVGPTLDRVPARLKQGEGDRVTWLGHAAVMFQAPDTTLLVDPYLQPKFAWSETEVSQVFSPTFADSRLFASYGPGCEQLSLHALPAPDAVLITHEDSDHFSLGALMALPPQTTIVVPKPDPKRPWDLDLRAVIHQLLGADRKVVALGHGEELQFGSVTLTAFPFMGEYPAALPHNWNCYLVETPRSVAILVADAALTEAQAQWLEERLAPKRRPATLFARNIYAFNQPGTAYQKGYQDSHEEVYSSVRLWPWFVPMQALFEPSPVLGISAFNCKQLVAKAGLKHFFPYALGSTPWFRFPKGAASVFASKIASMGLEQLTAQAEQAAAAGASLAPLQYGIPFRLG